MLSDRPYMREDYQRERTSFLVWMLSALIAGFIIQLVSSQYNMGFERMVVMSPQALKHWQLWRLLTYPLVGGEALQMLLVGLGIFFIGRELSPHVGDRRLMWFTFGAVALGGLTWFGVHFNEASILNGPTAILLSYLVLFGCLFPNREISFLLFFVIPVTTRPKYVAWICVGFAGFGMLLGEFLHNGYLGYSPYSAYVGAMAAAWLYYRYIHSTDFNFNARPAIELPRWMKRGGKKAAPAPAYQVKLTPPPAPARDDIRAEVDRILDKINAKGFGSLTPEEKRILDGARDAMSRR